MQQLMLKISVEHEDKTGKVIENDKCIAAIRRIEESKVTSIDLV